MAGTGLAFLSFGPHGLGGVARPGCSANASGRWPWDGDRCAGAVPLESSDLQVRGFETDCRDWAEGSRPRRVQRPSWGRPDQASAGWGVQGTPGCKQTVAFRETAGAGVAGKGSPTPHGGAGGDGQGVARPKGVKQGQA